MFLTASMTQIELWRIELKSSNTSSKVLFLLLYGWQHFSVTLMKFRSNVYMCWLYDRFDGAAKCARACKSRLKSRRLVNSWSVITRDSNYDIS